MRLHGHSASSFNNLCPACRLFLSAEPPPLLERPLPISLLQNSIKLTNEPPEGLKVFWICNTLHAKLASQQAGYNQHHSPLLRQANLRRAYGQFSEELMEGCAKQAEFRAIMFALSYFHAALLERKKFGVGNLPGATSGALACSCPVPAPFQWHLAGLNPPAALRQASAGT